MSDETRDRDDPAHQTMPPELRPFAKPEPKQRLVAPENEAEFKATIDALRLLNGGPNADPFYVDPQNDPAFAGRKAPESVKVYVPPAAVAAAEAQVRQAAPGKVVIAEASAVPAGGTQYNCGEVDVRPFREAAEARRAVAVGEAASKGAAGGERAADAVVMPPMGEKPPDAPASPWATEAEPGAVGESALPSSLRPPESLPLVDDAPTSTRPQSRNAAGGPSLVSRTRVAVVVVIVLVAIVVGVRALIRARTSENATDGPAPAATLPSVVPTDRAVTPPAPLSSSTEASTAAPARATGAPAPVLAASATPAPERHRVAPRPTSVDDDPYPDAAVKPTPVVTAQPVAPVATVAPQTVPPRILPTSPPAAPTVVLPGGDKLNLGP